MIQKRMIEQTAGKVIVFDNAVSENNLQNLDSISQKVDEIIGGPKPAAV